MVVGLLQGFACHVYRGRERRLESSWSEHVPVRVGRRLSGGWGVARIQGVEGSRFAFAVALRCELGVLARHAQLQSLVFSLFARHRVADRGDWFVRADSREVL